MKLLKHSLYYEFQLLILFLKRVIMGIEIKIGLNEGLYVKDPQDSVLGRNIIKHSILLLSDLGFEDFNFKKHSLEIGSTESSIYRYY